MVNQLQKAQLRLWSGHLRNERSLCNQLSMPFGQCSQEEILLAGYQRWGTALCTHLYGSFSFAIWDEEKQRLFCARDHFGCEQFYYCQDNDGSIRYATSIREITGQDTVQRKVNLQTLQVYMQLGYCAGNHTLLQGIEKLMPGCMLIAENNSLCIERYFEPVFEPDFSVSEQEWINRIDDTVRTIVKEELETLNGASFGSFLSGGVDSSYLLALTGAKHSFGIGYSSDIYDETALAQQTANMFGSNFHRKEITSEDYLSQLPDLVRQWELPVADSSAPAFAIAAQTAAKYCSLCFSGEGADEFFAGYHIYHHADALAQEGGPLHAGCFGILDLAQAASILRNPADELPIKSDILKIYEKTKHGEHLSRLLAIDISLWLEGDILFHANRSALQCGLKLRTPFTDSRLFALTAQIPSAYKCADGQGKIIFRKAAAATIPAETAFRSKRGFPTPARSWLLQPEAQQLLRQKLCGDLAVQFFKPEALSSLLERFSAGEQELWNVMYALLIFVLWAEQNTM